MERGCRVESERLRLELISFALEQIEFGKYNSLRKLRVNIYMAIANVMEPLPAFVDSFKVVGDECSSRANLKVVELGRNFSDDQREEAVAMLKAFRGDICAKVRDIFIDVYKDQIVEYCIKNPYGGEGRWGVGGLETFADQLLGIWKNDIEVKGSDTVFRTKVLPYLPKDWREKYEGEVKSIVTSKSPSRVPKNKYTNSVDKSELKDGLLLFVPKILNLDEYKLLASVREKIILSMLEIIDKLPNSFDSLKMVRLRCCDEAGRCVRDISDSFVDDSERVIAYKLLRHLNDEIALRINRALFCNYILHYKNKLISYCNNHSYEGNRKWGITVIRDFKSDDGVAWGAQFYKIWVDNIEPHGSDVFFRREILSELPEHWKSMYRTPDIYECPYDWGKMSVEESVRVLLGLNKKTDPTTERWGLGSLSRWVGEKGEPIGSNFYAYWYRRLGDGFNRFFKLQFLSYFPVEYRKNYKTEMQNKCPYIWEDMTYRGIAEVLGKLKKPRDPSNYQWAFGSVYSWTGPKVQPWGRSFYNFWYSRFGENGNDQFKKYLLSHFPEKSRLNYNMKYVCPIEWENLSYEEMGRKVCEICLCQKFDCFQWSLGSFGSSNNPLARSFYRYWRTNKEKTGDSLFVREILEIMPNVLKKKYKFFCKSKVEMTVGGKIDLINSVMGFAHQSIPENLSSVSSDILAAIPVILSHLPDVVKNRKSLSLACGEFVNAEKEAILSKVDDDAKDEFRKSLDSFIGRIRAHIIFKLFDSYIKKMTEAMILYCQTHEPDPNKTWNSEAIRDWRLEDSEVSFVGFYFFLRDDVENGNDDVFRTELLPHLPNNWQKKYENDSDKLGSLKWESMGPKQIADVLVKILGNKNWAKSVEKWSLGFFHNMEDACAFSFYKYWRTNKDKTGDSLFVREILEIMPVVFKTRYVSSCKGLFKSKMERTVNSCVDFKADRVDKVELINDVVGFAKQSIPENLSCMSKYILFSIPAILAKLPEVVKSRKSLSLACDKAVQSRKKSILKRVDVDSKEEIEKSLDSFIESIRVRIIFKLFHSYVEGMTKAMILYCQTHEPDPDKTWNRASIRNWKLEDSEVSFMGFYFFLRDDIENGNDDVFRTMFLPKLPEVWRKQYESVKVSPYKWAEMSYEKIAEVLSSLNDGIKRKFNVRYWNINSIVSWTGNDGALVGRSFLHYWRKYVEPHGDEIFKEKVLPYIVKTLVVNYGKGKDRVKEVSSFRNSLTPDDEVNVV